MNGFTEMLRKVGRGPHLSRPLTIEEAEQAMAMILDGEVERLQLGAFLLVLRYRTETPPEIAGFVRAMRQRLSINAPPANAPSANAPPAVDLDWPSYADAHKQLPYFLLAALLLAQNGVRIVMHGIEGSGPATTPAGLAALGITPSLDAEAIGSALDRTNLAYVPLANLCPEAARLFELKPALGLRTCIHTAARELNPFAAPGQIQGVFHPTYLELHQQTQLLLGQPNAITFKGGGGEGQRNPCKPARVLAIKNGIADEWRFACAERCDSYPWRDEPLDPSRLRDLWNGNIEADAPRRAVTGTTAMCLTLLDKAPTHNEAQAMSEAMWLDRKPLALA